MNAYNNDICERCGKKSLALSMSMLNTDIICSNCKEKEKKHPRYQEAKEAERKEILAGNYNYPGLLAGEKITFDV